MAKSLSLVFRYEPGRKPDLKALRDTVQRVFSGNGLDIQFDLGVDAASGAPGMNSVGIGECTIPFGDHRRLFEGMSATIRSPNQAVVFVVGSIKDDDKALGCAAHPDKCPGVLITQAAAAGAHGSVGAGRWALAHEIGHLLKLDHVSDQSSLMFDPPIAIMANPPLLSATERLIVTSSPLLGTSTLPVHTIAMRELIEGEIPERFTPSASLRVRELSTAAAFA